MMNTQRLPYASLSAAPLRGLLQAKTALESSPLDLTLIELIYLRVSQMNGCSYCLGLHANALRKKGESQQRLDALAGWHTSPLFSIKERIALQWAEALTDIGSTHAADEDYEALKTHFSDMEISDLTLAISLMNAMNRMAVAMRQ